MVVSLPIRGGPGLIMNYPLHLQWVTGRSLYNQLP